MSQSTIGPTDCKHSTAARNYERQLNSFYLAFWTQKM